MGASPLPSCDQLEPSDFLWLVYVLLKKIYNKRGPNDFSYSVLGSLCQGVQLPIPSGWVARSNDAPPGWS